MSFHIKTSAISEKITKPTTQDDTSAVANTLSPMRVRAEMDRVRRAVAACDASPSAPVVIFVSKMIPVKKRDITDADGKLWEPPPPEAAGLSARLSESGTGGDAEDDRDSLAFVAFARVLSGTVAPDTPLLVCEPAGGFELRCAMFLVVAVFVVVFTFKSIPVSTRSFSEFRTGPADGTVFRRFRP